MRGPGRGTGGGRGRGGDGALRAAAPSPAEPSRAEPSGASPRRRPAPRAPAPHPRQHPAARHPLTMPRTPPAPASPQPGAAPSASSCRAAAPTTQVSERDPHAPNPREPGLVPPNSEPCAPAAPGAVPPRVPASSLEAPLPCGALHPSSGPGSILPSWRSGRRPRGRLHPAFSSGSSHPQASGPCRAPPPFSPQLSLLSSGERGPVRGWAGAALETGPGSPTSRLPPHPHLVSCAQQVRGARKGWGWRAGLGTAGFLERLAGVGGVGGEEVRVLGPELTSWGGSDAQSGEVSPRVSRPQTPL